MSNFAFLRRLKFHLIKTVNGEILRLKLNSHPRKSCAYQFVSKSVTQLATSRQFLKYTNIAQQAIFFLFFVTIQKNVCKVKIKFNLQEYRVYAEYFSQNIKQNRMSKQLFFEVISKTIFYFISRQQSTQKLY